MKKIRYFFILFIFIFLLISGRLLWWNQNNIPIAEMNNGVADISNLMNKEDSYLLNGEWVFYPNELLNKNEIESKVHIKKKITVPGKWDKELNNDKNESLGFGTYHLKINYPQEKILLSLHFLSIRSASEIHINDEKVYSQGQVAKNIDDYVAENLPFTLTYLKEKDELEMDIIVQVANFKDNRGGGIVKSVQIGHQEAVQKNVEFTKVYQNITSLLFYFIAIVMILLRFVLKDNRLLFFAITLIALSTIFILSSEEKILGQMLNFSYDLSFKIVYFLQLVLAVSVMLATVRFENTKVNKLLKVYLFLSPIVLIIIIFTDVSTLTKMGYLFLIYITSALSITFIVLTTTVMKKNKMNIYLVFSLLNIISQLCWLLYSFFTGLSLVYYPFDLLLAIFWIIIAWLKSYIDLYTEKQEINEELIKLNEIKSDFLVLTSFQMRTPIKNMLNINKALLDNKAELKDWQIKELATSQMIGVELSLVIDNIINVFQFKNKNLEYKKEIVYPNEKIKSLVHMFNNYFENKDIIIVSKIDDSIGGVYSNTQWFIQIYYSLFKYTYINLNEGKVHIDWEDKKGKIHIEFKLSNFTMTEEEIKKVLEINDSERKYESLFSNENYGNLIFVNLLVYLQSGKFEILVENNNTTFKIEFLKVKQNKCIKNDDYIFKYLEKTKYNLSIGKNKKHTILILSNDLKQINFMNNILNNGYNEIMNTYSVGQALNLLHNKKIDLVISDVSLSEDSGYGFIRRIREKYTLIQLPVILISTKKNVIDIHEIYDSGANDYIEKPIDITEINAKVESLLYTKEVAELAIQFESSWLQAQIEPHFLFNTLNTIIGLSNFDEEKMQQVLDAFMDVLYSKYKYNQIDELVPLEEEIKLIKSYLLIEQTRYENKLIINWNIEENLSNIRILPLTMQPIIENAIRHGILKKEGAGIISIEIKTVFNEIHIIISDNGMGTDEDIAELIYKRNNIKGTGIGLVNTNQRLEKKFGKGIEFNSKKGSGTTVIIKLPYNNA